MYLAATIKRKLKSKFARILVFLIPVCFFITCLQTATSVHRVSKTVANPSPQHSISTEIHLLSLMNISLEEWSRDSLGEENDNIVKVHHQDRIGSLFRGFPVTSHFMLISHLPPLDGLYRVSLDLIQSRDDLPHPKLDFTSTADPGWIVMIDNADSSSTTKLNENLDDYIYSLPVYHSPGDNVHGSCDVFHEIPANFCIIYLVNETDPQILPPFPKSNCNIFHVSDFNDIMPTMRENNHNYIDILYFGYSSFDYVNHHSILDYVRYLYVHFAEDRNETRALDFKRLVSDQIIKNHEYILRYRDFDRNKSLMVWKFVFQNNGFNKAFGSVQRDENAKFCTNFGSNEFGSLLWCNPIFPTRHVTFSNYRGFHPKLSGLSQFMTKDAFHNTINSQSTRWRAEQNLIKNNPQMIVKHVVSSKIDWKLIKHFLETYGRFQSLRIGILDVKKDLVALKSLLMSPIATSLKSVEIEVFATSCAIESETFQIPGFHLIAQGKRNIQGKTDSTWLSCIYYLSYLQAN